METITIGKNTIRRLAVQLLDEENGIKEEAYHTLSILLVESGNEDLLDAVKITEDRAYIYEDFAQEELERIEEEMAKELPDPEPEEVNE